MIDVRLQPGVESFADSVPACRVGGQLQAARPRIWVAMVFSAAEAEAA